jgi:hypothetical protein
MVKSKDDIKKAVLLLRYHTETPVAPFPAFNTYASISKAVGVTYNKVYHICKHSLKT